MKEALYRIDKARPARLIGGRDSARFLGIEEFREKKTRDWRKIWQAK